jgi:multiple sugar transport system substrate-binding protein
LLDHLVGRTGKRGPTVKKADVGEIMTLTKAMGRRAFLKLTGVAVGAVSACGLGGILEARRAPAYAQIRKLQVLQYVDFVPKGDGELRRQVAEAGRTLGAEITLETINANDLQARITAAIESRSGPDIIHMLHNWSHLYSRGLTDVSDLAEWKAKDQGGFYDMSLASARVGDRWLSLPYSISGFQIAYRKSWFDEVEAKEFPKTWQEYREVGKKLKAMGRPLGQSLGHTWGDAPSFAYPYLWSWGGKEVEKNGKTVAINSKEAIDSLKFMAGFWKDAHDEDGLAWDDTNNNRAFNSGQISATLNGASIYLTAKRNPDKVKDEKGQPLWRDILHAPLPTGPAGQFAYHTAFAHGIMKYSKEQTLAKEFLKWLHSKDQFVKWFELEEAYSLGSTQFWETHPLWEKFDVSLRPYRTVARAARMFGHAGPPTAKASDVYSKHIIVDLYAKVVRGMAPADAAKWAEGELKKIYR